MITSDTRRKLKSALWMIKHYSRLRGEAFAIYPNLVDYYIIYDHYSQSIEKYEKLYDDILEGLA